MKGSKSIFILVAAACLVALLLPRIATAQQSKVIDLSYGTPVGPDHTFSVVDAKWIAKIEKETNGRVKIKPYWGGSIIGGKDAMEELRQDAVDIAFVNPSTSRSGYAILKASYLFFYGADQKVGGRVFKELLKEFPEIEKEYMGLKVLAWGGSTHQLITRKPVRKIDDLRGMRMKVVGDISASLKDLGVEGMSISNAEVYVGLQKGILDGVLSPVEALESLKFAEVAKYVTLVNFYRSHSGTRMMNLGKWNSLPPDIKKVFEDNIDWYGQETDAEFDRRNEHAIESGKKLGVEFIPISKEEMAKFYAPMKKYALIEAQGLDAKGLPGTKILNETQRLIKLYSK